jgi:hypothetical protein
MTRSGDIAALRRFYPSLSAYACLRLVTVGDGAERGVRVLEMRSGGGLDIDIAIDRGFDIDRLALDGVTLSWHSANGMRSPWLTDPASDRGQGYLRTASGFLATCGLDHIRQPETDRLDGSPLHPHGEIDYPLHGHGTNQPARLVGYGLDEDAETPVLWAEGEIVQSMTFLGVLRLRRRITMPLGGTSLSIRDRIDNVGPFTSTHMMLYHFNLGHPLVAEGTRIEGIASDPLWLGRPHDPLAPFGPPVPDHTADLSIFPLADRGGVTVSAPDGPTMRFSFDTASLPFLQILRMPGNGLYGLGIEPCTTGVRSRKAARETGQMLFLAPGESRNYAIDIALDRKISPVSG